jgi:hypothetical protein
MGRVGREAEGPSNMQAHTPVKTTRARAAGDLRVGLVQLHEQLHEQLHNFNSQTANSLPNSLASFSVNSLSQS